MAEHKPEDQKYIAEAEKLRKEALPPLWLFRWGPLFTAFSALAIAFTLFYSLLTFREGRLAREEERFRVATEALGSKDSTMRAVGASMVQRFLDSRGYRNDAMLLLANLFALEVDEDVVYALGGSLSLAADKIPQVLQKEIVPLKERILSKILHSLSQEGNILGTVRLLQDKLYVLGNIEKSASKKALELRRSNFQCWRKINAHFSESNLEDAVFWRADLYKADFSGANLKNALFKKSNLSYADFRGADLGGADLTGANVFNARFEGAKNINLDAFRDASWASAHFDPGVTEKLKEKLGHDQGRQDLRKEGMKECKIYEH